MKNMILVAALSFVSIAQAQHTGSGFDALAENGRRAARLEHCGGTAQLSEAYVGGVRRPVLTVSGVERCSNILINGEDSGKISNGNATVVIYERAGLNINTVTLESNSRKTQDTVRVNSFGSTPRATYPAPTYSNPNPATEIVYSFGLFSSLLGAAKVAYLPSCGGTAEVRVTDGTNITVVFRNVQNCSKFDILGANGYRLEYPTKSLQRAHDGDFGGSFTIPARFIQFGGNAIKVILKSNSGKTDEVMLIQFAAI